MDSHIIIIRRPSGVGPLGKYKVLLDGIYIGKLGVHDQISKKVCSGLHEVSFVFMGKTAAYAHIHISEEQQCCTIDASVNLFTGKLELQIHDEPYQPKLDMPYIQDDNGKIISFARACGMIIASIACFIIIISLLFGGDSSDKATNTVNETNESSQSQSEINEDKATSLLKDATDEFESDDYTSGFEICNDVLEKYPDTNAAANIESFKNEQIAKYPHLNATDLMSLYSDNIVNADNKYKDKAIVVSGVVSSIGKTNGDRNLCVLLKSNEFLGTVQLNFSKKNTESVASLVVGSSVTALGKCTGKSGKVLLLIDAPNVMIEDCVLIK